MGKLNYTNRKSEGPKLGQIVAKDLRKRCKQPSSSSKHEPHRDTSPLEIHLEGKNLTDEGLSEAAQGLEEALRVRDAKLSTRLQHLNLSRNCLSSKSLHDLAPSICLAADDLEELDLSHNEIRIDNDEDSHRWETFLQSLRHCSALKKLNLSGNHLAGTRTFEILARVYATQFRHNVLTWTDGDELLLEELGLSIDTVESRMQGLSMGESPPSPTFNCRNGKLALQGRGLPSVQLINLSETQMTDSGALFLSDLHEQHNWFQEKLATPRNAQLSVQSAAGIISLPNEQLSAVGSKLLRLSTTSSYELKKWSAPAEVNVPFQKRESSVTSSSSKNLAAVNGHRRVSSSSHSTDNVGPSPSRPGPASVNELDSLRKKLQRTILENDGAQSVQLWATALRLLAYSRAVLVENSPVAKFRETDWDPAHESLIRTASASAGPRTVAPGTASRLNPYPNHLEQAHLTNETSSTPITPVAARHVPVLQNGNPSSAITAPGGDSESEEVIKNGPFKMPAPDMDLIGGLPRRSWKIILGNLADPDGMLSERQKQQIVAWASSRRTLMTEMESLGKPTSVQIWRALDAMGCLEYDASV